MSLPILGMGLSLILSSLTWLEWLANKFQRSACLPPLLPVLGLQPHAIVPGFYKSASDPNLGPRACQ